MSPFDRLAARSSLTWLSARAMAAESVWQESGSDSALDAAIDAYNRFVRDIRLQDAEFREQYAAGLLRCARLLTRRTMRRGADGGDLDEARAMLELAKTRVDARRRASLDVDLGMVHRVRYKETRSRGDLDAAVGAYRRVVESAESHPQDRTIATLTLAETLLERHLRWPELPDVDEVGALADMAVTTYDLSPDDRCGAHGLVADALLERARLLGATADAGDLDRAIVHYTTALELAVAHGPPRLGYLQENLALAHEVRYQLLRSPGDLDRCIELLEAVVARET